MKKTCMLVLMSAALGTGCAEADFSLILDGPIVPTGEFASTGDDPNDPRDDVYTCEFKASTGPAGAESVQSSGVVIDIQDLESFPQIGQVFGNVRSNSFFVTVSIANQLEASDEYSPIGFDQNQRLDQNGVILERAEVTFPDDFNPAIGLSALDSEKALTGLAGTNDAAFALIPLVQPGNFTGWQQIIQGATGGNANVVVPAIAQIQVFGVTAAGDEVESNLLRIPIELCAGCEALPTPLCFPGEPPTEEGEM